MSTMAENVIPIYDFALWTALSAYAASLFLQLKTNSILNKYVKPIGLPKKDKRILANIKCSVAGWGMRFPSTAASDVLRETAVKTRFVNECKNIWLDSFNSSQMICTHSSGKKGGICQVISSTIILYVTLYLDKKM
jgi:hypothetical protein